MIALATSPYLDYWRSAYTQFTLIMTYRHPLALPSYAPSLAFLLYSSGWYQMLHTLRPPSIANCERTNHASTHIYPTKSLMRSICKNESSLFPQCWLFYDPRVAIPWKQSVATDLLDVKSSRSNEKEKTEPLQTGHGREQRQSAPMIRPLRMFCGCWAVLPLCPYLEGTQFIIQTDHKALNRIQITRIPEASLLNGASGHQEWNSTSFFRGN